MDRHLYQPPLFGEQCAVAGCARGASHPSHYATSTHNARANDPDTSHAAAEHVRLRSGTVKARLILEYGDHGPMTDAEAAAHTARPWDTRKRCSDLRNDGLLERVGTAVDDETHEHVMVCALTAEGRAAYSSLSAQRAS